MTSPGCIQTGGTRAKPTPPGVPVAITSPGASRVNEEKNSTALGTSTSICEVRAACMTCPFSREVMARSDMSSSSAVTTSGPMGMLPSEFLPAVHWLAARLRLPILTLIDTPGAAAAPADEAAGIGPAIAELFVAMASSPVPVTSVVIGEGVSGGALALASPSDLWIAQDGYLAVTTPELATSILKLGVDDVPQVATWLRLTPAELMSRGIVRGVIRPPAATASVAGQAADPR